MTWLSRAWEALRGVLPGVLDLHLYGGGALAVYGVAQVWEPGAWIVGGLFLLSIGVWQLRRAEKAGS